MMAEHKDDDAHSVKKGPDGDVIRECFDPFGETSQTPKGKKQYVNSGRTLAISL